MLLLFVCATALVCVMVRPLQYYLADASMLECLACGCDGLWGAASPSGAGWGHASTLVALTNLARLGNPYVEKTFDMPKLFQVCWWVAC